MSRPCMRSAKGPHSSLARICSHETDEADKHLTDQYLCKVSCAAGRLGKLQDVNVLFPVPYMKIERSPSSAMIGILKLAYVPGRRKTLAGRDKYELSDETPTSR